MIIAKYHVSCDICHTATLEIKAMMIHNAVAEIKEAGWSSEQPVDQNEIPLSSPYLARHACPDCQDQKDHERRGESSTA